MRKLLALIACLPMMGCLYGAGHGRSTTTYVNDDGLHPVQKTTVTQSYEGSTVGASLPLVLNGGYGGVYGGAQIVGGGYGGGSTACVLHPDRCAVVQTATVYQTTSINSMGGAYGTSVGYGGGSSKVGPGGQGTYAPTASGDDEELSKFLAKHEKAITALVGQTKQNVRQMCQIILANPDVITDDEERKDLTASCRDFLAKHPYTASASAHAGEEK